MCFRKIIYEGLSIQFKVLALKIKPLYIFNLLILSKFQLKRCLKNLMYLQYF